MNNGETDNNHVVLGVENIVDKLQEKEPMLLNKSTIKEMHLVGSLNV